MARPSLYSNLDLRTLDNGEIDGLLDLLFPVHQRIFGGGTPSLFRSQVLQNQAEHSYLQVRINRLGQVIGYCAVHFFHIEQPGRRVCIMRSQAGLLPAYRGGNSLAPFILARLLGYRLRHPATPIHFFATLIHPSSYLQCHRYARQLWPRPEQGLPADVRRVLQDCLSHFGYHAAEAPLPRVVPVGWRTLDNEADHHHWRSSPRPAVRFFLQHNPAYLDGQGLVTLAPVSLLNLLTATSRLARDRLRRRLGLPHAKRE
ncbi:MULTISPECIES: hypothetical protein [unclassified Paludibacterium]|uniref:hypothetical protein n=1 Tax=unclassified Paludibacterium TaxID=2618429 RepID=UPI001C041392|nr:hypothetical protein [Paludibacterium sp. B53371]BEV71837.1 hypothetical protein THUN1379_13190 [Paludibacterium sp. THUN1379]